MGKEGRKHGGVAPAVEVKIREKEAKMIFFSFFFFKKVPFLQLVPDDIQQKSTVSNYTVAYNTPRAVLQMNQALC